MATAAQVATMMRHYDQIDAAVRRDIRRVLPRVQTLAPEQMRDVFLEIGPQLTDRYGELAATAGAEFFETTTGRTARLGDLTDEERVHGSIRALAAGFWTPARTAAFDQIAASMVRHSLQAGRSTIAMSASRARIGYARSPEPGACAWCIMLASRGPVYGTVESAGGEGNEYHDHCRCVPEPVNPGDRVSYDADRLYEQYRAVWRPGMTDTQVAAAMRQAYGYD